MIAFYRNTIHGLRSYGSGSTCRAKQGDVHLQTVLDRYDRMIASKRERREFGRLVREALVCVEISHGVEISLRHRRWFQGERLD